MCIIVVKPKNKPLPTADLLETCFNRNPHGAGIMYPENGKIRIIKGLMDFQSVLNALNTIRDSISIPIVIHFRYATHGETSPGNTHPFPLISDFEALQVTDCQTERALCHNGIMSQYGLKTSKLSDTAFFCKMLSGLRTSRSIKRALIAHKNGNKFVVLISPAEIIRVGDFVKFKGCFFSNGGFKESVYQMQTVKSINSPIIDWENWNEEDWKNYDNEYWKNKGRMNLINKSEPAKERKYLIRDKEVTKEEFFGLENINSP